MRGVPLYQVCADGSADVIDYLASSLLGDRYQRFQPVLKEVTSVFQADEGNMNKLRTMANDYLQDKGGQARLKALAHSLLEA